MSDINQREVLLRRCMDLVNEIEDVNDILFTNTVDWRPVLEDREQAGHIKYLTRSLYFKLRELSYRVDLAYDSPQFVVTWTIGRLQQELRDLDPHLLVKFDYDEHNYVDSFQFHSYRGWYHHLAIGTVPEPTDVQRLIKELDNSLWMQYEGYRGGYYYMFPETPVWAAEDGSSGARAIVGISVTDDTVTIQTAEYQHDFTKD